MLDEALKSFPAQMSRAKYLGNRRGDKIGPPVLIEKWTRYTIARGGRYSCWTAVSSVGKKKSLSLFEENERQTIVKSSSNLFSQGN